MTIIEQTIAAKSPTRKTEDAIVATDNFIAVIDGSTSKSDYRVSRWRSNGRQAARLITKYIKSMNKTTTMEQFCKGVCRYLFDHYRKSDIDRLVAHPEDRMTASCIVYSRLAREIWMIGDCQCLIGEGNLDTSKPYDTPKPYEYLDNPKPYEAPLAAKRATEAHRLLAEGCTTLLDDDLARQAIIPDMIEAMKGQNISYAVIDGFNIPLDKVRKIALDFRPWTIVMATDGYPFLKPTLAESEAELARQKAEDPLNINTFKATKAFMHGNASFDDRAYIRFTI